jgi:hypothetical protein
MGIQDAELVEWVCKLEDLQQKKCSHPRSKVYNIATFESSSIWNHFSILNTFILCVFFVLVCSNRR